MKKCSRRSWIASAKGKQCGVTKGIGHGFDGQAVAAVLIKQMLAENPHVRRMTALGEKLGRYGFVVDKRANKLQIKKAVKELYGVEVEEVNTMTYAGKRKSRFTKAGVLSGKTNSFKKAIITLAKGESIDFYSNI